MIRRVGLGILLALLLVGCAPTWEQVPAPYSPYDWLWEGWNARYRQELIERCRARGHHVLSEDPVRCLGPSGEYVP